jgi:hypothetical protein
MNTTDTTTLDHGFALDEPVFSGKFPESSNDGMVRIQ